MTLDTTETILTGGGNVYTAPVDTAEPVDIETTPAAPWVNIGYLQEDGPVPTGFQRDKTTLYAWNVNTPLRTSYAPAEPAIGFTLLQWDENTLKYYFGGGTFTVGSATEDNEFDGPVSSEPQQTALLIDWFDGARKYRWWIPNCTIAPSGDMNLTREELVELPVSAAIEAPSSGPPFRLMWTWTAP